MKPAEFILKKIKYIEGIENADTSFIPPLALRRMSSLDKVTAAALRHCFDDDIEYIIFSSQTGELERLLNLISSHNIENEVSPAVFAGSVHNAAIGAFLINQHKPVPYNALAAGDDSFAAGLTAAAASRRSNVLYVYSDLENGRYVSLCLYISKNILENGRKYRLSMRSGCEIENIPPISSFASFFNDSSKKIETYSCIIEKVCDDKNI